MRVSAMAFASVLGLVAFALSASATPVLPAPIDQQGSKLVRVAGGCGWGFHPNRWSRCVPNRYGYYRSQPYWAGPYYRWHSPGDYVANQLNREQLRRPWGY